jgi:hypothetical protein
MERCWFRMSNSDVPADVTLFGRVSDFRRYGASILQDQAVKDENSKTKLRLLPQTKNLPSLNSLLGRLNPLLTFKNQLFKLYFKIISYMRPYLPSVPPPLSLSFPLYIYIYIFIHTYGGLDIYIYIGHAMAQMVEALRYKPEGRGFDSRWCY